MRLGYNTNGFAHHRLADAIEVLSEIGYASVAISLDHHALNPYSDAIQGETRAIKSRLESLNMRCVIETGARFLLDPRRRHWPTLLTANREDRSRRIDFLQRAIEIGSGLGAEAISFWSGARDPKLSDEESWTLLVDACGELLDTASSQGARLAFEPEPGMFIETMSHYQRLADSLEHPRFGLTLDVGHVHCLGDGLPADRIREFADDLWNVHIEDMVKGRHEHRMFGEGEMAFESIFEALLTIGYRGSVNVELSRHSHDAVSAAREAFNFLSRFHALDAS
ncbi:MAG: sugar phosphate isomerase/epimerase family protein [Phycisphaerae bacterium]